MRLLFAITVGCFCAVMWVALALARRIRLALSLQGRSARQPSSTQEFFEADEFRTPRPVRLEEDIVQQKPHRPLPEIFSATVASATVPVEIPDHSERRPAPEPTPIRPPAAYASLYGQAVSIARIDSHLHTSTASEPSPATDTAIATTASRSAPLEFSLHRRPPQPARPSRLRRLDLSQFSKDMGDLTDPYSHPLRGSGTQGPVLTDRISR